MTIQHLHKSLAALALILAASFSANAIAGKYADHYMIDILYFQEGKTIKDAQEYFKRIEPIVKKHGLVRVKPALEITDTLRGMELSPNSINIWELADPENTLPNIMNDPEYQKHVTRRNSTFDMEKTILFYAKPSK